MMISHSRPSPIYAQLNPETARAYPQTARAADLFLEALEGVGLAPGKARLLGLARIAMVALDRAFDAEVGWARTRPEDTTHIIAPDPIDPAREPTWREMAAWGRQEMRDTMYSAVPESRIAEIASNLAACDAEVE